MKLICPVCKEPSNESHIIEVFLDDKGVYGVELCPDCKDKLLKQLPGFRQKPEDVGVKIVTQEQLMQLVKGEIEPEDLPDAIPGLDNSNKGPCSCGCTVEEVRNTGMLGCPHCYDHFKEELEIFNTHYHGANKHIGKKAGKPKIEKLKILKLLLAKAKEVEHYERAKELWDEIQSIENPQINDGSTP